ncbi:MAG: lysine decarboxylase, partial [Terriglobia bacterium]
MGNGKRKHPAPPLTPPLAYRSERFLESGDARTLRIVAEYLEPQARLRRAGVQNTVVFFGSARIQSREEAEKRLRDLESHRATNRARSAVLKTARTAVQMS